MIDVARAPNGHTLRLAAVGVLVLVLLIPLAFVQGVTNERQRYFEQAAAEVAAGWGGAQAIAGPVLVVPEVHDGAVAAATGDSVRPERRAMRVLLPRSLDVSAEVRHEFRSRGIYQVPVYQAVLRFSGTFVVPEVEADVHRLVDEARLLVGITDTHGIDAISELDLAGAARRFGGGTGPVGLGEGVHAEIPLPSSGVPTRFAFEVRLRGSGSLGIAPVGAESEIRMTSTWAHPSFTGRFLPSEHEIGPDGFSARWVVHELARPLPASWLQGSDRIRLTDSYASVSLFQPVTGYTRVDRGIKYGVLFIGLTFLTFVCFELLGVVRFHYVHYAVVGAGLVLFYLTLLSLSETLPFVVSYVIAAALLGALVGWYVWRITRRLRLSLGVSGILALLYLCLYVLLALEAFALLVGTGVLLAGLFALMYATSRLDGAVLAPP